MSTPTEKHQGDGYWLPRADYNYYKKVREYIDKFGPGESILDVGGADTPIAAWGNFDNRVNVTKGAVYNRLPNVEYHIKDFLEYDPESRFDLVTCLQVLEHLGDETVIKFVAKLLTHTKKSLIVSVPHLWDEEANNSHVQDPIDIEKLVDWFKREPDKFEIVSEEKGIQRIVAQFNK